MKSYGTITFGETFGEGESIKIYVYAMPDDTIELSIDPILYQPAIGYVELKGLYPYMGTDQEAKRTAYNAVLDKLVEDKVVIYSKERDIYWIK